MIAMAFTPGTTAAAAHASAIHLTALRSPMAAPTTNAAAHASVPDQDRSAAAGNNAATIAALARSCIAAADTAVSACDSWPCVIA